MSLPKQVPPQPMPALRETTTRFWVRFWFLSSVFGFINTVSYSVKGTRSRTSETVYLVGDWFAAQGRQAAFELALQFREIALDHDAHQFLKRNGRLPTENPVGFRGVGQEIIHLGGAEVAGIDFDVFAPVEARGREGELGEFTDRMRLARADDAVAGFVVLEHQPHRADIIGGVAPVPARIEIAEIELIF